MGKAPSLDLEPSKKKRLSSSEHASILEDVYKHSELIVDFYRAASNRPRPEASEAHPSQSLGHAMQRHAEELRNLLSEDSISDEARQRVLEALQKTEAPLPRIFSDLKAEGLRSFQETHGSLRPYKIKLQPFLDELPNTRSRKPENAFIDLVITEIRIERWRIEPDDMPMFKVFSRTPQRPLAVNSSGHVRYRDVPLDLDESIKTVLKRAPSLRYEEATFDLWVEIRPEDVAIGSLIADMKAIRSRNLHGFPFNNSKALMCIGPRRSPEQVEMLNDVGVAYMSRDELKGLIPKSQPLRSGLFPLAGGA